MDIINDAANALAGLFSGLLPEEPEHGLVDGRLRPCPGTPNCVCSEGGEESGKIDPIALEKGAEDRALERVKAVVGEMGGVVRNESKEYLWSTFAVPVFGFVDDVEFRLDRSKGVLHVRSASRVGYSDLGVNRGRVEDIRRRFEKAG